MVSQETGNSVEDPAVKHRWSLLSNRRFWAFLAAAIFIIPISLFIWSINFCSQAEQNLQSGRTMARALMAFIEKHQRWPDSEQELAEAVVIDGGFEFDWPDHRQEICKRVHVTYGVPVSDVARSSPGAIPFLQVRRPNYDSAMEPYAERLIETARKAMPGN